MFPHERQHCEGQQQRHPDGQEGETEQEKAIDFTVFEDAYSAVVSGEQIKQKEKEYCMSMFSDLTQRGFFFVCLVFFFCYLLVELFNTSNRDLCARRALALSSIPYFLSVTHTHTMVDWHAVSV